MAEQIRTARRKNNEKRNKKKESIGRQYSLSSKENNDRRLNELTDVVQTTRSKH